METLWMRKIVNKDKKIEKTHTSDSIYLAIALVR